MGSLLFLTGQLGASRTFLGLVEGVGEMLGYTVRMASGTVSDRMQKRKPLVLIGYSLYAASPSLTGGGAAVPKNVASHLRGTAYGLYNMVIGFSFFAANLVFGFMLDSSGIAAATAYSIIMSAVTIAALAGFQALARKP